MEEKSNPISRKAKMVLCTLPLLAAGYVGSANAACTKVPAYTGTVQCIAGTGKTNLGGWVAVPQGYDGTLTATIYNHPGMFYYGPTAVQNLQGKWIIATCSGWLQPFGTPPNSTATVCN